MSNITEINGCQGASKALAVLQQRKQEGQHFVVCETEELAKIMDADLKALGASDVVLVPDTETLPYDLENPHSNIRARRNQALHCLAGPVKDGRMVVCSLSSFTRRVATNDFWKSQETIVSVGMKLDADSFEQKLTVQAYEKENLDISEPGEFVRNADVFDIFSMGMNKPIRISIKNNIVKTLHSIDIETNRNIESIEEALIIPAYEFLTDESALRRVRSFIRSNAEDDPMKDPVYAEIKETQHANGLEYFIPELTQNPVPLFELNKSPKGNWFFIDCDPGSESYWEQATRRYEEVSSEMSRVVIKPDEVWCTPDELQKEAAKKQVTIVRTNPGSDGKLHGELIGAQRQPNLSKTADMLSEISERSKHVSLVVSHQSRIKQVEQILMLADLEAEECTSIGQAITSKNKASIILGRLSQGFLHKSGLAVISDREIFGNVVASSESITSRTIDFQKMQDLENLEIGDPLVHLEYGVGRFAGLQNMDLGGQEEEMLRISYAEDVIAFVPMSELYLVTRFGGLDSDKIPVDQMGSKKWNRNLNLSVHDIENTAIRLVAMREHRQQSHGVVFKKPGWRYHRFCNGFEFEPTPDQQKAFDDVSDDLCRPEPMDRLIVGDVGFGKTEVALRAAFHAVENNQNVAIAAPTSILANQHFHTFTERFSGTGVTVEHMDSLTPKKLKTLLEGESPSVIVGTHSALRIKEQIREIGLFIVDEEHRFGTRDKELISALHGSVNILNMTATPIPRTLTLSLSGIRDISIIATPPSKRLSVRTLMAKPVDSTYREGIERELLRNGQVYVLHNRTTTLEERAQYIRSIMPEARVKTLHGKMSDDEQKEVLIAFAKHEFDVLVCTTVIEIGIDVPRANTILIEDPERLGLSQLHQIRGRVGRSDRQGYAYIVTDPENTPKTSMKRFQALIKAKRLGDGFVLASHDLEIRGAGELLGEKQSGHIYTIGFSLYSKILMRAVEAINEGRKTSGLLDRDRKIDLNLNSSGFIDSKYIDKASLRLTFYKRLASCESLSGIRDVEEEMAERFGDLPEITQAFVSITKIRLFARLTGISKAIVEETRGYVEANSDETKSLLFMALEDVSPSVEQRGSGYRFFYPMPQTQKRFSFMIKLMSKISSLREEVNA